MLKFSPVFTRGNAQITNLAYVAPVEQVSFIGWNGTAGALDTEIDATYVASVRLENTQGVYNNTPIIKTVPVYLPDDVALAGSALGQFEHATRLIDSFAAQFSEARLAGQVIRAERVSNGTRVVIDSGAGTATGLRLTNGSARVVSIIEATGAAGTMEAGEVNVDEIVHLRGSAYQVVASDADGFTLDRPYLGASEDIVFDTALTGIYDDGTLGDATTWGVRLTGVTPAQFDAKTDMFPRRVRFQASYTKTFTDPFNLFRKVTEPADAAFTTTVAANEGVGTGAEIAKREVYTNMNEQNHVVSHFPPTNYRDSAILTNNYRQIMIQGFHNRFLDVATGKRPISQFNIIIALEDATVAWDTLNVIFAF